MESRRRREPSSTPSGTLLDAVQHLARRRPAPFLTPSSTLPDAVQKTAPTPSAPLPLDLAVVDSCSGRIDNSLPLPRPPTATAKSYR